MWKGLLLAPLAGAAVIARQDIGHQCPGYKASNVQEGTHSLTADLSLAGKACNVYGADVEQLKLLVEYQTGMTVDSLLCCRYASGRERHPLTGTPDQRLHVIIYDANEQVYQVPESVLPRPKDGGDGTREQSALKFDYTAEPFAFTVTRDNETLFDTSASALVFETQYLGLRTWLPEDPSLYGLGEHSDPLRMPTTNYTRTLWNRDAGGAPNGTNLYGSHPVYYDHRGDKGTHGVFLLNSNGMDVTVDQTSQGQQYLQYNALGGVFDFYFFTGATPKDVSAQYAEIVGLPAMQSYWTLGFHNCKYGYRDIYEVAEVVHNYSAAGIPLETMWNDIDYMDGRKVFTNDPARYPLSKIRELVDYLHDHNQHYIVMVDPAVSVSSKSTILDGS